MKRLTVLAGFISVIALFALLPGCGEKIAIPEPSGVWANLAYSPVDTLDEVGVVSLATGWGNLFVLSSNSLTKRSPGYENLASVDLFDDPRALCVDETGRMVFVWEQQTKRVKIFDSSQLEVIGLGVLPLVQEVSSMVTSTAGVDSTYNGGCTFLYLTDPVLGLIHRCEVFCELPVDLNIPGQMVPYGALAWPEGGGVRSVHEPAGLARDLEGRLLVCEKDPDRNWVIRFDSDPDYTDPTQLELFNPDEPDEPEDPEDPEEPIYYSAWAGKAVIFDEKTCEISPAADYVLGNAATCDQTDWVGGPSVAEGEFDQPLALAVDGSGRIFVADSNNSRIQIFSPLGEYMTSFKIKGDSSQPYSLGPVLYEGFHAAYIFVLMEGADKVFKFQSEEHYFDENGELFPREE
ncbi:MAG: hypothetical protein KOO60_13375 [Gemmatimonadales bacterium]|nr:hypothetical protein [Gemmatimonadales bacterium]